MRILVVLILLILAAGCRIPPDVSSRGTLLGLSFAPDPPRVGDSVAVVTVTHDREAEPNVPVALSGIVNIVGRQPVVGAGTTDAEGHAVIPLILTEVGDWTLTVTVTLPNGAQAQQDFHYYVQN